MVTLEDLSVSKADFPTTPDNGAAYLASLRPILTDPPLTTAPDRLQAEREGEQTEDPGRIVQVKNDPPRIIVSRGGALLGGMEGKPVWRGVGGPGLLGVVNTRVLLALDRSAGRYYFWLRNRWLAAPELDGPGAVLGNPPAPLEAAKQAAVQSGQVDLLDTPAAELTQLLQTGAIPAIHVSTVPAELIVLRGQPALAPIAATDILQVTNTDDDLFLYTPQQEYYVLLSGRWFRAASLQGRWEYVASGLPGDFARIPESHPKGAVLASVPGTPQARQAVIANGIPQTATISRSRAELAVHYDGPPQLEPIEGTPLQYVVNASFPVIRVDPTSYYALQNGVWFAASSLDGSWAVATSVPPVIFTIPASSPLHYVTYSYVYGSTPDVVYTGYTPGYLGPVVAPRPIVAYGTGYVYPGWARTFRYPWPVTWGWGPFDLGFGVDVFTGFAFGFSVGPYWGWHHGWGWHGGCCWGWHHGISHLNVYHHWGEHAHITGNHFIHHGDTRGGHFSGGSVYAGRDGRVYRRDGQGHWQEHTSGGGWGRPPRPCAGRGPLR